MFLFIYVYIYTLYTSIHVSLRCGLGASEFHRVASGGPLQGPDSSRAASDFFEGRGGTLASYIYVYVYIYVYIYI